jgi:hypothetical protein
MTSWAGQKPVIGLGCRSGFLDRAKKGSQALDRCQAEIVALMSA